MPEYSQLNFDWLNNYKEITKSIKSIIEFKMKKCSKCGMLKEASTLNFTKHYLSKDKLTSWCNSCKCDRVATKNRDRIKNTNLCIRCDNERLPNSQCCSFHHIDILLRSQKTNNRFKNLDSQEKMKTFIELLLTKFENQNFNCAITGEKLELGINASIDHIIEKCNGGSCEIENLQWVTKKVNNSKPRKYKND